MSALIDGINKLEATNSERYHYILEALVQHLYQGGQWERLKQLFADQSWGRIY